MALLGQSAGVLALRIGGRGISFATAVVLARLLGVEGYGVYVYAIAWITVVTTVSLQGYERVLLQQIPTLTVEQEPGVMRAVVEAADKRVIGAAIGLTAVAAGITVVVVDDPYRAALLAALPLPVMQAFIRMRAARTQGMHRIELSMLPGLVIAPLLTLAFAACLFALDVTITATSAVLLTVGATLIALFAAELISHWVFSPSIAGIPPADPAGRLHAHRSFLGVYYANALGAQMSVLLLGILSTATETGLYQPANRLAELFTIVLVSVNAPLIPLLSRLVAEGNMSRVAIEARRASRASLFLTAPVALVVFAAPGTVLDLFGSAFGAGAPALVILAAGQLFNALSGSVGNVLMMTGHHKVTAQTTLATLVLALMISIVLIPSLGATGAAIGRSAEMVVRNLVQGFIVYRRLGINASAVPWPRSRASELA